MPSEAITGLHIDLPPRRRQVLSNGTLGMLAFVIAETMMFLGLISAFTLARATAEIWPPPGQPRLPVEATALTTLALLISGVFLYRAGRVYRNNPGRAYQPFMISIVLGTLFVVFQGAEWVALLNQGLTMVSSQQGSFFYLIVGMHGLHAFGALALMWYCLRELGARRLTPSAFGAAQVLWFFVVGIWPLLYLRVYL
jgi:heme/copper-type cytochrome/quinol oxidase subunit 3